MPGDAILPVLIVGGGPVGLSLAVELGWRGIPCLLVERRDGSIGHPKMNMVSSRTMEICRRWGIAGEIRRLSIPEDYPRNILFVTSANGYELARFEYPSRAEATLVQSPEALQRCSQLRFDPLLQRAARGFPGVSLKFRHELVDFAQDEAGVTAEIRDLTSGETRALRSAYLVGCDGADSVVRERLGIPLLGDDALSHDVNVFFESEDFAALCPHSKAIMQWIIGSEGYVSGIVSVDGVREWRVGLRKVPQGHRLTEEEAAAHLRRAVGCDFDFKIRSILAWTRRRLLAQRYGIGRVFLAGDCVHQLSPTGGFGMNTGIGDAIDIGWKLAATLQGWGGANLLASYERERQPIGAWVTDEGARNFSQLARLPSGPDIDQDTPQGRALREEIGRFIRAGGYDREYDTEGLILGYRYENSPIIVDDGSPPPPNDVMHYRPSARPGHRAPHLWLKSGESTLDLFGRGFTLFCIDADVAEAAPLARAAERSRLPLRIVMLGGEAVRIAYERRFVLVRPDGTVAWRADAIPAASAPLVDRVRGA